MTKEEIIMSALRDALKYQDILSKELHQHRELLTEADEFLESPKIRYPNKEAISRVGKKREYRKLLLKMEEEREDRKEAQNE